MIIKVINRSRHPLPEPKTDHAAGLDLKAHLEEPVVLKPGERGVIPTGLYMAIPPGFEGQVRPRSGLAAKYGITVLNTPGTIDADYRGQVKVILINHGQEDFAIEDGDRIAQMVLARYEFIEWDEVEILEETERNEGGFGSTGRK